MSKIVAINSGNYGSTGRIMLEIAEVARENGHTYYTFSGPNRHQQPQINHEYFGSRYERYINMLISKIFGYDCAFFSKGTKELIKKIGKINPNVIHLHNIHGWYLNYNMLFKYVKINNIRIVWTLHDCWSFTGKCPHFTKINCNKWMRECFSCKQKRQYPSSFLFNNANFMFKFKKKVFSNMDNVTIVVVSKWLEEIVKKSFLKDYQIKCIFNGIDTNIFKPTESEIRKKYGLEDKIIILGVAYPWSESKGLNDFLKLAKHIENDKYKIVLIGLNKDQIIECKKFEILGLPKTENVMELIKWYSTSNILFNPSVEETFGMVTAEAMACGTPVIVYNSTASPELVENTLCFCTEVGNIEEVKKSIVEISEKDKSFYQTSCTEKVFLNYNKKENIKKYLKLY